MLAQALIGSLSLNLSRQKSTMSSRTLIKPSCASNSSGYCSLRSRSPQLLCNSSTSRLFMPQSYSTERAGSVMPKEINWPGSVPRKKKYEDDPERRAEYLRRASEYNAHYRATDPDFARKMRERMYKLRLQPEVRLYYQDKAKAWRQSQSTAFAKAENFRIWIRRYAWFREDLNWTTWRPILYPDQVEHWCQGCNLERHRGSHIWWKRDPQNFLCHSCYMKLPEAGLPEGYEGCTTIKEIAKRKATLESQPRTSTTSTLTGQSWKPPKTSPTGSRLFSTLRAVWTKSKESKFDHQEPAQDCQPEEWTKLEAEMLEAKRQYDQMRSAWKPAQNLESGSQEVTENDVHGARRRLRRAKHAWRMVSDPAYEAQQIAKERERNHTPQRKAYKARQDRDNYPRSIATIRYKRANDPLYRLSELVDNWTRYYSLARRMVDWTPYKPILYSEKVRFHCRGCGRTRADGLRLWWRRKPDPTMDTDRELYLCPKCFLKSPNGRLPKAYEDCTTLRELNKRCQKLEGVRPKHDRTHTFDVEVGTTDQKKHDPGVEQSNPRA